MMTQTGLTDIRPLWWPTLVAFGAAFSLSCAVSADEQSEEFDGWAPQDMSQFTRTKEGGFPLNVDPKILSATEADLAEDDLVMGAVINGEARAYPVNYMNGPMHEVVNDELGGLPIAPTW